MLTLSKKDKWKVTRRHRGGERELRPEGKRRHPELEMQVRGGEVRGPDGTGSPGFIAAQSCALIQSELQQGPCSDSD